MNQTFTYLPSRLRRVGLLLMLLIPVLALAGALPGAPLLAAGAIAVSEGAAGCVSIPGQADPYSVTYCDLPAAVADAEEGDILTLAPGEYTGGVTLDKDGLTLAGEPGAVIGPGSDAIVVAADDVTIRNLTIDGDPDGNIASSDSGIVIAADLDNLIIQNNDIQNWASGIRSEDYVDLTNLKIVGNWIHDNGTGIAFGVGGSISGATGKLEGNLIKENSNQGILNNSNSYGLDARFNSWGDAGGAGSNGANGVAGTATINTDNPTFAELYLDMDPSDATPTATVAPVYKNGAFTVAVRIDSRNLNGVTYGLSFPANLLDLESVTPGDFIGANGTCSSNVDNTAGTVEVSCLRHHEGISGDGLTVSLLTFVAVGSGFTGAGPFAAVLEFDTGSGTLTAGAGQGIKVFVNNDGYGADSGLPNRDITNANDGEATLHGAAIFGGYIDLQGRTDDSGAVLQVFDQQATAGAVEIGSGTSDRSGFYTTDAVLIDGTYWFQVDRAHYLPTTVSYPALAAEWAHSKSLDGGPSLELATVVLRGGDANDNNRIDIGDASCIGSNFGLPQASWNCAGNGNPDVTGDGVVGIEDLTLMGGNYDEIVSPWTP